MLKLIIEKQELFNEETEEFFNLPEAVLRLEHSLVSLSKWESIFEKPFINDEGLNVEETKEYIRCMCLDEMPSDIFKRLTVKHIEEVNKYIDKQHTATWFSDNKSKVPKKRGKAITSELIYYWMVALNIPFECETWNLNRLITLIKVCNIESQPPKKMSKQQAANRARELNRARREQMGTSG